MTFENIAGKRLISGNHLFQQSFQPCKQEPSSTDYAPRTGLFLGM